MILPSFLVFLSFLLKIFDIGIPYFPLSYLSSNILCRGWNCGYSSFFDFRINCLDLTTIIIELISHWLLDCFNIFPRSRLLFLCLRSVLIKHFFSNFFNLLLSFKLCWSCMNVISFQRKVDGQIINSIIHFMYSLIKVIGDSIHRCLRIDCHQGPGNCHIELLLS